MVSSDNVDILCVNKHSKYLTMISYVVLMCWLGQVVILNNHDRDLH